jgi:hypothetical protein
MIYIQSNETNTIPHHFDSACAMYGAIESAQDYKLIKYSEVESGKFDNLIKRNLFVGSVEFMKAVFNRVGLTDVRLPANSNRIYHVDTLGNIKKLAKSGHQKFFIKPFDIKLFTGFVIDQMGYTSIANIPDETEVMVYEPFKNRILTEWRCYVSFDKIIDIRNYSGDIYEIPSKEYLNYIVNLNRGNYPSSYTIDVGILEWTKEHVVIEYNDMWAIGNYGVPNDLYLRMLSERYFDIMRKNK